MAHFHQLFGGGRSPPRTCLCSFPSNREVFNIQIEIAGQAEKRGQALHLTFFPPQMGAHFGVSYGAVSRAALHSALQEFTLFYNHVRPHQGLTELTPAEKWNGYCSADITNNSPKQLVLVQALQGLMAGYYLRR